MCKLNLYLFNKVCIVDFMLPKWQTNIIEHFLIRANLLIINYLSRIMCVLVN